MWMIVFAAGNHALPYPTRVAHTDLRLLCTIGAQECRIRFLTDALRMAVSQVS